MPSWSDVLSIVNLFFFVAVGISLPLLRKYLETYFVKRAELKATKDKFDEILRQATETATTVKKVETHFAQERAYLDEKGRQDAIKEKFGPSLDGKLSATIIPVGKDTLVVTVEALWNNRSPLQVHLDIGQCQIRVFPLDTSALKEGDPLVLDEEHLNLKPICDPFFLKDYFKQYYFFEPNTANLLSNHFVLRPGLYGIRMDLFRGKGEEGHWYKDLVVDVQPPKV
jgi:hypothetical protein